MAYEFKNLNEVPTQDAPTENTTVMAFESGSPRQIPAREFGGKGLVVDLRGYTLNTGGQPTIISDINYDPIYEAIMAGQNVVLKVHMPDDSDLFAIPINSLVLPHGEGFNVIFLAVIDQMVYSLIFTNGSYNTIPDYPV